MNRRISLTLSAAAGGLLASAFLPAAIASGDAGTVADAATTASSGFPDAPGADAFDLGNFTFDPFLNTTAGVADPTIEGFNPLDAGSGTPGFFEAGYSADQGFEVFGTTSGSSAPTYLGIITTSENVTSLGNITNTGFDVTGDFSGVNGPGIAGLPAIGTVYDVTNFGSGYENIYTDVPGAAGAAGTVTDSFVTPFGDYNLSDLVTAFDLSSLDPTTAFGLGTDAAGVAADAAGGVDPLSFLGL